DPRADPCERGSQSMRAGEASNRCDCRLGWSSDLAAVRIRTLPGVAVKHWVETAAIVDRLSKLIAGGHSAAVATVVRVSGSAYRRPGAKLLVEEDGTIQGGVSGGCLENDVRALALEVLRGGASRMLHYDTGSDEETLWGLGLGCEGAVDVYLQRIGSEWLDAAGKQMRELVAAGTPFAVITIVRGPFEGKTLMLARGSLIGSSGAAQPDR